MNTVDAAPTLPTELLFRVLDEVVADGFPAFGVGLEHLGLCPYPVPEAKLAASHCMLVSHTFHDYLLPVTFSRITISSHQRLMNFDSFLSSNPRIRPHVHSLVFSEDDYAEESIWIVDQNLSCLLTVLELLKPTLRELSLDCQFQSLRQLGEDPQLARRLAEFLKGSHLRSLRLRGVFPPADMVHHLPPNLQYLDFERCRLDSDHEWAPVLPRPSAPLTIKTMRVSFSSSVMSSALKELEGFEQPPLPNLTHFILSTSLMDNWSWSFDDVVRLAPNLKSMQVQIDRRRFAHSRTEHMLTIDQLCVKGPIETLEILRYIAGAPRPYHAPGSLSALFATATEVCKLTTIHLIFRTGNLAMVQAPGHSLLDRINDNAEWSELDKVLSSPNFENLRTISIHVGQFRPAASYCREIADAVRNSMPSLRQLGRVKVEVDH
ncbi:hypothetical protein BKA70DRAFT_45420 [Coprinopsis sp. MPI-PUGE-AT-0042]|nr:hypothetical protein BKA70DRAFT_45420 [Coprinopsis sp. MPI-PUGE-AT-0042]